MSSKMVSFKEMENDDFIAKLNDMFDMDQQVEYNHLRRQFAKDIEAGGVHRVKTKAFVSRLVVDLLNYTARSQYEKLFPDWHKINTSGIFISALIGDMIEVKRCHEQIKDKIHAKKMNLDLRVECVEDVDNVLYFLAHYDPLVERISTTVTKNIPEDKIKELVHAINELTRHVKYVVFQAIHFTNPTLFDEMLGKATNRLQIFYTHKVKDEEYEAIKNHIQEQMNGLDLPGQANVYTVINHKKRYELIRKQVEESEVDAVLEPSAFGEHIKTIDLRKVIPDEQLEQLQAELRSNKLYLWMSEKKEVENFYRLANKCEVEIDLMQIFLDKELKLNEIIQNSLVFECLKHKNVKFNTLTICSIESQDLFIDHVVNILPQVRLKLDLRTNIKFTEVQKSNIIAKFTAVMQNRPKSQKLEIHFVGKQHVIQGVLDGENFVEQPVAVKEIEEMNNQDENDKPEEKVTSGEISEEKPEVSEDKPEVSEEKPEVSEEKPEVSEDKSEVSEKEPTEEEQEEPEN